MRTLTAAVRTVGGASGAFLAPRRGGRPKGLSC